jgi:tetratricopeptide (TPR) repeat protein
LIWGVVFLAGRTGASGGKAWDEYYKANSQEGEEQRINELASVADEYHGTIAGLWARQTAGDARLLRGTNLAYRQRVDGQDALEKAKSDFLAVISEAPSFGKAQGEELRLRATWGLAQTYESLADQENAIKYYEEVAKTWPDSAFGKAAKERGEYLQDMGDWFQWYAKVDPSTIEPTARRELFNPGFQHETPRQRPPQPFDDLPDLPDLSLPDPLELTGSSADLDLDLTPPLPKPEGSGDDTPPPNSTPDETPESTDPAPPKENPPATPEGDAAPPGGN